MRELPAMPSLPFWTHWLLIVSILLAVQGVSWMIMGSFDPIGIYDAKLARVLLDADTLSADAKAAFGYGVALLGATDAAFFALFAIIVRVPFSAGERWAHAALALSILTWFLLDSVYSISVGAWFNVLIVNIPCLLLVGIPLVFTAPVFYGQVSSDSESADTGESIDQAS
jgi:hypothetical protein